MSGLGDVTFNLRDYNHQQACRVLTRRLIPAAYRYALLGYLIFLIAAIVAITLLNKAGVRISVAAIYALFGASWLLIIFVLRQRRRILWNAVQSAPARLEIMDLVVTDTCLTLVSAGGTYSVNWPYVVDAVPAPDGILVLLGGMDYLPVPAAAFADKAAEAAFLALIKERIATNAGRRP